MYVSDSRGLHGLHGGLLSKVVGTVMKIRSAPAKLLHGALGKVMPKFIQKIDFEGIAAGAYPPEMKKAASALQAGGGGDWDDAAYLRLNPDVANNAGWRGRPWEHYVLHGSNEGRRATFSGGVTAVWDRAAYLAANPDVAANKTWGGDNAFRHFVEHGSAEGRQPTWTDVQVNGVALPQGSTPPAAAVVPVTPTVVATAPPPAVVATPASTATVVQTTTALPAVGQPAPGLPDIGTQSFIDTGGPQTDTPTSQQAAPAPLQAGAGAGPIGWAFAAAAIGMVWYYSTKGKKHSRRAAR